MSFASGTTGGARPVAIGKQGFAAITAGMVELQQDLDGWTAPLKLDDAHSGDRFVTNDTAAELVLGRQVSSRAPFPPVGPRSPRTHIVHMPQCGDSMGMPARPIIGCSGGSLARATMGWSSRAAGAASGWRSSRSSYRRT